MTRDELLQKLTSVLSEYDEQNDSLQVKLTFTDMNLQEKQVVYWEENAQLWTEEDPSTFEDQYVRKQQSKN
jgi:hypothetical protein